MFELNDITINDKNLFNEYYNKCKYTNSEANFTNMLMWQKEFNIKHTLIEGYLVLFFSLDDDCHSCQLPIGSGGNIIEVIKKIKTEYEKAGKKIRFRPLVPEIKDLIEREMPGEFEFTLERNFFDYIYSVNDLINLSGRKYHSKKNHLNQFINTYSHKFLEITKDNLEKCREAAFRLIESKREDTKAELLAAKILFDNYIRLPVKGAFIEINGEIAAVTVGEDFHGSVLIHFEKADPTYMGIYAAINNLFLKNFWSGYEYVNREEDMGIEGLRKAKLSYKPVKFIEKYTAR